MTRVVLLAAALPLLGNSQAVSKYQIVTRTQEICTALVEGHYGRIADLTFPKLVELNGGRDKMMGTLSSGAAEMKARGFGFIGCKVGTPSDWVRGGDHLFVLVPVVMEMRVPNGKMSQEGTEIAISSDQAKTWTFIDGGNVTLDKLRILFPEFPQSLKLPEKRPPVMMREN